VELRHLRTFLAVAETLNISEAARRLHVTQPALSRHIRDLEHSVGHPLFVRHPNGLRLTASGEALQESGSKAVAAVDGALSAARTSGEKEEQALRFGYYSSVCIWANILGPAFGKLARKHPKATTSLSEASSAQLVDEIAEGRLDAAILGPGEFPAVPGVITEVACTVPALAMMANDHPLAKKRKLTLSDLKGVEVIGLEDGLAPGRDAAFVASCRAEGFSPKIAHEANGLPELMILVTKRRGVAILDSFARVAPVPGITFVEFKAPGLKVDIHAAYAARRSPVAKLLVELTLAEARRAAATL
jgi:LysR family transcriptional regulator, benzoate and cis,cis-muconate-responsive activator of ben and cat genes